MGCGGSKPDGDDRATALMTAPPVAAPEPAENEADNDGPLTRKDIEARIVATGPEEFELTGTNHGVVLRYACVSQRGYYPEDLFKANQDAFVVTADFNGQAGDMLFGVFDGHGGEGDLCSRFVRKHLGPQLSEFMKKKATVGEALEAAYVKVNQMLFSYEGCDSEMSGTTAVVGYFHGGELYVANAGDSRIVLGERRGTRMVALPLSSDQTPHRKDERERCKKAGSVIRTAGMIEGITEWTPSWEQKLGTPDAEEENGDPPRLFARGDCGPGCAFTRSIGDGAGEAIGVYAVPELVSKQLREPDQFVTLASDGVWEFITSQEAVDTIMLFENPLEACRALVAESYRRWLQYDVRTDDITIILAWLDSTSHGKAPRPPPAEEVDKYEQLKKAGLRISSVEEAEQDGVSLGLSVVGSGADEVKPTRKALSPEMRAKVNLSGGMEVDDHEDLANWTPDVVEKTDEERKRIHAAVQANTFFDHLTEEQRDLVYKCMQKRPYADGEVIIRQGEQGDWFYVLDEGELSVTVGEGDPVNAPEILTYEPHPAGGANPCFGELALLYSRPRGANVVARSDGVLWAIDRRSFRAVLMRSSETKLLRTLRGVQILRSLSAQQLRRLALLLSEVSFHPGELIIKQGDPASAFYVIASGRVSVTKTPDEGGKERAIAELGAGDYFGERGLLNGETRGTSVSVPSSGEAVHCYQVSKDAFEEVLGPLVDIIRADSEWRVNARIVRQMRKVRAKLTKARVNDFARIGIAGHRAPMIYINATYTPAGAKAAVPYTLKAISKSVADGAGSQDRVRDEVALAAQLFGRSRFVPMALTTLETASHLFCVYPTRVATTLRQLLDDEATKDKEGHGVFPQPTARFYIASISLILEHLQNELPAHGGVVLRDLSPDAFAVDEYGYLQLLDMRCACAADPPRLRDYVGFAHYLAPEVIAARGHGVASEQWGLGMVAYEMLTGTSPWLTGDATKDTELAIYARIIKHKAGKLKFPAGVKLSPQVGAFLNALIHPEEDKRLGVESQGGAAAFREHPLFAQSWANGATDWLKLAEGTVTSPHADVCAKKLQAALDAGYDEAAAEHDMADIDEKTLAQTTHEEVLSNWQAALKVKEGADSSSGGGGDGGHGEKRSGIGSVVAALTPRMTKGDARGSGDADSKVIAERVSRVSRVTRALGGGGGGGGSDELVATTFDNHVDALNEMPTVDDKDTEGGEEEEEAGERLEKTQLRHSRLSIGVSADEKGRGMVGVQDLELDVSFTKAPSEAAEEEANIFVQISHRLSQGHQQLLEATKVFSSPNAPPIAEEAADEKAGDAKKDKDLIA